MKNNIKIRNAQQEDLVSVTELWKEFMDFHKERDIHFTRSNDGHKKFSEFISSQITNEDSCVLVAEYNSNIVGYCSSVISKYPPVFDKQEYGSIFDLAVTEKYRRLGIGEALFEEARKWFYDKNIQRIEVKIVIANEVSSKFWRKTGFSSYIETMYMDI